MNNSLNLNKKDLAKVLELIIKNHEVIQKCASSVKQGYVVYLTDITAEERNEFKEYDFTIEHEGNIYRIITEAKKGSKRFNYEFSITTRYKKYDIRTLRKIYKALLENIEKQNKAFGEVI